MSSLSEVLNELIGNRFTNSELADRCDPPLDHSFISRLRSGQRMAARSTLISICNVLKPSEEDRERLLTVAGYYPERLQSLFDRIVELSREDQDRVGHYIEFLRSHAQKS